MGKPKKLKSAGKEAKGDNAAEDKGKKSYSFGSTDSPRDSDLTGLQKVVLSPDLEQEVIDLIQEDHHKRPAGQVSKRLTSKKLTDMYESLSLAGFKHDQIEKCMSNIVPSGGDLIDALDWLCLFTQNDRLPEGFSETLQKEEEKKRPKFGVERQKFDASTLAASSIVEHVTPQSLAQSSTKMEGEQGTSMKDWILQYADDEEGEGQTEGETEGACASQPPKQATDPNEKYLELTAKLLDARSHASQAKLESNKKAQKEASTTIRNLIQDMEALECHVLFNPAIKIQGIDQEKDRKERATKDRRQVPVTSSERGEGGEPDIDCSALTMFEEMVALDKPEKKAVPKVVLDVRNFEYTRQQWTGKSPKQFLIDWVRKHLPRSKPPSYQKKQVRGNLHRCQVTVERKKEGDVVVMPDIVCENGKDAEHLACTLALYYLCRGQAVYQLLPPPYRTVWLEWEDAEKKANEEMKTEKNKPRDQFLSKLLKKLQLEESKDSDESESIQVQGEEPEDSWENLADDSVQESGPTHHSSKIKLDEKLMRSTFLERQNLSGYQDLLTSRQTLPVFQHKDAILNHVGKENVVVIAGETGSGKSTQIPHFILEQFLLRCQGHKCNIICTQPRRISAISLANRVSEELGEKGPGTSNSFCGYQIRFEVKKCKTTRLTYCTTGVLLRQLQIDPMLSEVTHVIVDEVHERTMQSDFLMIILKNILKKRPDFKVILMSATLDSDKFSSYFYHCPVINIPGRTYPVQVLHMEDVIESLGYVVEEDSTYTLRTDDILQEEQASVSVTEKGGNQQTLEVSWTKEDLSSIDKSGLDPNQYCLKTRNTVTRLNEHRINMDLIVELLKFLSKDHRYSHIEGAVLVFLPGLAHIQELYELLQTDRYFNNPNKYKILALHSVLSSQDQSAAFTVPPPGVRKIVIATNIAETGITIPDVVFVIDSGKAKENRYIESSQMSCLEEVFISKASAKQRQGRAGRVREGYCFRIYTKYRYTSFKSYSVPELLRVPLEELCLHIMKCELGDPQEFLSHALDPPQQLSISKAMALLREVGACYYDDHSLTPLGQHLSALPVHVRIGKMLIFGALFGCLEPVAVIAAAMADKPPFASPLGKREEADLAKKALSVAYSDHLTLYKAYLGWKKSREGGRQSELDYCNKTFLKRNSLLDIENVKTDLIKLVESIGFCIGPKGRDRTNKAASLKTDLPTETVAMVKAVLTAGLYPNVAKVTYEAPVDAAANLDKKVCLMETPQGIAQSHPSSVNRFLQKTGLVVYHEKVKLSRVYIRDSTVISPHPVLLFGGDIEVQHRQQLVTVDKWIKFKAFARTGVIYRELRLLLDKLLQEKLEKPSLDLTSNQLITVIIHLLKCDVR